MTPSCRIAAILFVMNDISPKIIFVPMLYMTAVPSAASSTNGSTHEVIVNDRAMSAKAMAITT